MIQELIVAGLLALQDYIALHVLTCLIPAFLLAGGLVAFINKEAILDVLGERASRVKSFSLAMAASFFLAACSCTVIPVSAGLYYSGAAVGVAFIILWVAPSANILCLTYTGSILGGGMVFARVTAALIMASVVGLVMTWFFAKDRSEEKAPVAETSAKPGVIIGRSQLILMFLITLSLLLPNYLIQTGSYINKVIVWAIVSIIAAGYAWKAISAEEIKSMLRETWWFVKIIFPLLLAGVFLVGVLGKLLPETWIRQWLGGNGVLPSFIATMIGAISYFATMTEAPFVDTLMNLGMGKGPALALLLTGPGLSLPNWIAIARVFSVKMSIVYVVTLVILGTFVGWFYGNFIF